MDPQSKNDVLIKLEEEYMDELTREEYLKQQAAFGYYLCFGNDNTLQVDIDNKSFTDGFGDINKRLLQLVDNELIAVSSIYLTNGRRGRGFHLHIRVLNQLPLYLRIAMQLLLGSDPTREILNMKRWSDHKHLDSKLYECLLLENPQGPAWRIQLNGDRIETIKAEDL